MWFGKIILDMKIFYDDCCMLYCIHDYISHEVSILRCFSKQKMQLGTQLDNFATNGGKEYGVLGVPWKKISIAWQSEQDTYYFATSTVIVCILIKLFTEKL